MSVDHRFDRLGEQGSLCGFHSVAFASAEPEPIGGVDISNITHSVPNHRLAIIVVSEDFVQFILIGTSDVALSDARAVDQQFTDLTARKRPYLVDSPDGFIGDFYNFPLDLIKSFSYAGSEPLSGPLSCFFKYLCDSIEATGRASVAP